MKEKYKCIYNMRLAGYLMLNGIPIQRIERNLGRPWRNVFLFEDTEKISKLIEIYKQQKSKENDKDGINNEGSSIKTKGQSCGIL